MMDVKDFVTNYWGVIAIVVVAGIVGVRYAIAKSKAVKSSASPADEILSTIKNAVVESSEIVQEIVTAEKNGGREAAEKVVSDQLTKIVNTTTLLTSQEKAIIGKFSFDDFVKEVIKELEDIGALVKNVIDGKKEDKPAVEPSTTTPETTDASTDSTNK